jgi:putative PIN family toxin of toxin-antitoxin system
VSANARLFGRASAAHGGARSRIGHSRWSQTCAISATDAKQNFAALLDDAQPIVSEETLTELAETLSRPKFDPYVSQPDRQRFFELFARVAEWVPVTTTIRRCRDPKDDKVLELAVDGNADWIITGDKDLLELSPFQSTSILTRSAALFLPDSVF